MDSRPAGPARPTSPRLRLQTPHTDPRPAGQAPTPSPRSSHVHAQSTNNTTNPRPGSVYSAVILVAGVPWERWGGAPMVDAWADVQVWGNRDVGGCTPPPPISTQRRHHRLRTAAHDETRVPKRSRVHARCCRDRTRTRNAATTMVCPTSTLSLSFVPVPASPRQRQRQRRVPLPAPALDAHLPVIPVVARTSPRRD
ncbi:hypothetical protein B0H10DRAFT_1948102 [Mycena sp. CBHHK59/15]|nr:hypothetical protein B0H10DRAFT_1948102 [Mycena sp. CBHHK59/15]